MTTLELLSSDIAVGLTLGVTVLALFFLNRLNVRDALYGASRFWRACTWLSVGLTVAAWAWGTFADRWRQLMDEPYRLAQVFPSKRVVLDPVSIEVRIVTAALCLASVIALALLVARFASGYGVLIVVSLTATILWVPAWAFRRRMDLLLAASLDVRPQSPAEWLALLTWLFLDWLLAASVMIFGVTVIVTLLAIPIAVILHLSGQRERRPTHEAASYFASFGGRAADDQSQPTSS